MKPGKLIKTYREKANKTQLQLCRELGYEIPQFISLIENGHSQVPLEIALIACEVLNIPKAQMISAFKQDYAQKLMETFGK